MMSLLKVAKTIGYIGPVSLRSAPAGASGIVSVEYGDVPRGLIWKIERVTVQTDSAAATTARLYLNSAGTGRMLADGTNSGNLDVGDQFHAITMPAGHKVEIEWTGMSLNAVATAVLQIRVEQLVTEG